MSALASRLAEVDSKIAARLKANGREAITRIVVSKFHPAQLVRDLYTLGVRDFGENRDQEASVKSAELTDLDLNWHFIGQLQSNKVKSAIKYAGTIHSLDRESLLTELIKQTGSMEKQVDVFVQVNLTDDEGRGGVEPSALSAFADRVASAPGLNLLGLMAVASLEHQEERDFAKIAQLSSELRANHPKAAFISAGMSGDYELAIDYGATHLRIGTAITGNRPTPQYS